MKTTHININYDRILETALLGVRRAAVFMGLGLNAALDPDYKEYQLTTEVSFLQFMPQDVDDKAIARFKEDFAVWIIGNGLRELIESFAVFLDQIYAVSMAIALSQEEIPSSEGTGKHRRFLKKGLKDKLESLRDDFGIATEHIEHLSSIQKVRTCLTHRRGIVGTQDCNQNSTLVVRWVGMFGIITSDKSCTSRLLDLPLTTPVAVEGGEEIRIFSGDRAARFCQGSVIRLKPSDVAEMCFFVTSEAKALQMSAVQYAKSKGIEIRDLGQTRPSATTEQ